MFFNKSKIQKQIKTKELSGDFLTTSLFFYFTYLILFFLSSVGLSCSFLSIPMAHGMIIAASIMAIKGISIISKLDRFLIIVTAILFLLYPLLNINFIFNLIIISVASILILRLTFKIASYVL